jgi:hypothetical protein
VLLPQAGRHHRAKGTNGSRERAPDDRLRAVCAPDVPVIHALLSLAMVIRDRKRLSATVLDKTERDCKTALISKAALKQKERRKQ